MSDDDVDHDVEREDDGIPPGDAAPDAADPASQRRQRQRVRKEQREAVEFWKAVFASEVGRREMWKLLQSAHTFEERFACGPTGFPQTEATWFHAGEQAFGQRLYQTWLRDQRDGVAQMHDEHDPRFKRSK